MVSVSCLCFHINLLLFSSHYQGQKVATCLFITCPRSSEMQSSCKCSYLLAMSSPPKCLWIERPIRANVLVSFSHTHTHKKLTLKKRKKNILKMNKVKVFGNHLMPLVSFLQLVFAFTLFLVSILIKWQLTF